MVGLVRSARIICSMIISYLLVLSEYQLIRNVIPYVIRLLKNTIKTFNFYISESNKWICWLLGYFFHVSKSRTTKTYVSLRILPRILDSVLSSKRAHKVAGESRYSNAVMISYDLRYHVKKIISLLPSKSVLYVAMALISHFLLYYILHQSSTM